MSFRMWWKSISGNGYFHHSNSGKEYFIRSISQDATGFRAESVSGSMYEYNSWTGQNGRQRRKSLTG